MAALSAASASAPASSPPNVVFFFVKPHAATAKGAAACDEHLASVGIKVLEQGVISAADATGRIDQHYGQLAQRAMSVLPRDLPTPPAKAQDAFLAAFGVSWDEALAAGTVTNVPGAYERGAIAAGTSAKALEDEWRSGKCVKLFPGTYCAAVGGASDRAEQQDQEQQQQQQQQEQLQERPVAYVVNGFYPSMAAKFTSPALAPNGLHWRLLELPADLSWSSFRTDVIGPTDPAKADRATSVRGMLYARWEELGLPAAPFGAENGVHASASPLEAFHERLVWLGGAGDSGAGDSGAAPPQDDPFVQAALRMGCTPELVAAWRRNPQVEEAEGKAAVPLFDVVELQDTQETIQTCMALCPSVPV